jgi:hypothetical protein
MICLGSVPAHGMRVRLVPPTMCSIALARSPASCMTVWWAVIGVLGVAALKSLT